MGEKVAIEIRWENDTVGDAPGLSLYCTLGIKACYSVVPSGPEMTVQIKRNSLKQLKLTP